MITLISKFTVTGNSLNLMEIMIDLVSKAVKMNRKEKINTEHLR
jgi:hypothetical protein